MASSATSLFFLAIALLLFRAPVERGAACRIPFAPPAPAGNIGENAYMIAVSAKSFLTIH
jgi:hypothetical protein